MGNGKKTTFLFGVNREEENLQSVVFAITPAGIVSENVANPSRDTDFSFRVNHKASKKTTFSIRYEFAFDSTRNGGVGGFNLPEVATNSNSHDQELFLTHRTLVSPKLVNEFTVRVGSDTGKSRSLRTGIPRLLVLDAFTGGGSQADRRSTETYLQLNEIISWNHGRHFVRGGLNLPNIARRGISDRSNFGGTFSFSTLADFVNNTPFLFSINQGDGRLVFWQTDFVQLNKSLVATANYVNTRGIKLFRSRNINAPPPPSLERPDPAIAVLRQIESSAQSQAHALEVMLRGKLGRFFNGTVQYNLGRAYNNAAGINSLPANNYDLTGEWSRAEFDERHRFNLLGTIEAGEWFNVGLTLSLISGRPYTLTTGRDDNRDSIPNERPPGVRRNSLQGPGAATLDVRWSKEFSLKPKKKEDGPAITLGIDAFNVLNRTNFTGFVGNLRSPFFGLPVASRPARRVQFTFGFEF